LGQIFSAHMARVVRAHRTSASDAV